MPPFQTDLAALAMAVVRDNQWRVKLEADDPAAAVSGNPLIPGQSVGPWRAAGRGDERSVVVHMSACGALSRAVRDRAFREGEGGGPARPGSRGSVHACRNRRKVETTRRLIATGLHRRYSGQY